jgi:diguanylate cyclase (GGDEF)-like protein
MTAARGFVRYAAAMVLGAFAIAAAVITTLVAFDQINLRQQRTEASIAAAVAERAAYVSLVDEETAVSGYVRTGDRTFLEPFGPAYDSYAAYRSTPPRLPSGDAADALARFAVAGDAIQPYFTAQIERVQRGQRHRAVVLLPTGQALFNRIRDADAVAIAAVKASMDADTSATDQAMRVGQIVIIGTGLMLVFAGASSATLGMRARAAAALARRDELTQLPNRRAFEERLTEVLTAREPDERIGVLCIDLDHFKPINDRLGHAAGDDVLALCGERLRRAMRPNDFVARIGGDEFAVVLGRISSRDDAHSVARRVVRELETPFVIHGTSVYLGASVGEAIVPDDGDDPKDIVRIADEAMYRIKQAHRSGT